MRLSLLLVLCAGALSGGCSAMRNFFAVTDARDLFERGYLSQFRDGEKLAIDTNLPAGYTWTNDQAYGPDPLQTLDILAPTVGLAKAVLVFVHGGGWRAADKRDSTNVHHNFCVRMARRGMVVINVNHRLSPEVKHPAHIQDIAQAVKWVKQNINRFNGDVTRVYLSGHSSGAHLVALLAMDGRWITEAGSNLDGIAGVIGISGVYDLALASQESWFLRSFMSKPAFGNSLGQLGKASPVSYPSSVVPKFLLVNASEDEGSFAAVAQTLANKLKQARTPAQAVVLQGSNHFGVLLPPKNRDDILVARINEFMK